MLLADDSVTAQRIVALSFADESFRVVSVADGQQAIDSMAVRRPDIVLAGTALPRTNGYELAKYMRGVELLRDVPVLLLSGAFESVDTARLEASGARGVIEKPLAPTVMISRVRELLGLKDPRPTPSAGRLVTAADTPPAACQPSPTTGGAPTNAVCEVDSDWFSGEHKARETDSRNESVTDAHAAMPPCADLPANPIYQVDDEWCAEDEKAREAEPLPNVPAPLAPEITEAMLDQIAQRVADRLNSGAFAAHLRDAVVATVRDTVRSVVSDTSERLVRDEIARIKSKTQT